jgi:ABC-type sugar transport system ATPase subunit
MDEPTAALNAGEVDALFSAVAALRSRGVGVLYISHRLDEIQRVGDRVIVLRDGERVGVHDVAAVTREQIVAEIVGRQLGAFRREHRAEAGESGGPPALEISGLSVPDRLQSLDLTVRPGEIVGLYGLAGSGVETVAKAVVGATPGGGTISVSGRTLRRRTPASCRAAGLAHVPADRRGEGIFPLQSVGTNIAVSAMAGRGMATPVTRADDRRAGREWAERLDIRPRDPDIAVGNLSGGNQQKSIFARWLAVRPRAFVLDEPTKGVDVGAKSQMYDLIANVAQDGAGVIVISSELSELVTLCTRIGVITRGRLVGVYPTTSVDEQRLVDLAIGGLD